jgi:hypothetical protein
VKLNLGEPVNLCDNLKVRFSVTPRTPSTLWLWDSLALSLQESLRRVLSSCLRGWV